MTASLLETAKPLLSSLDFESLMVMDSNSSLCPFLLNAGSTVYILMVGQELVW